MSEPRVYDATGANSDAHEGEPPPFSTRIPAAIARAKAELGSCSASTIDGRLHHWFGKDELITATEVALAEQLWATEQLVWELQGREQPPPPSLIAFTTKVEPLG